MNTKTHTEESGFTLIEMLIAMIIMAIGLLGIAALHITAIQGSDYSIRSSRATSYITNRLENMKTLPPDQITASWGSNTKTETVGAYTITTTVNDGPVLGSKDVQIVATWTEKNVRTPRKTSYRTVFAPK